MMQSRVISTLFFLLCFLLLLFAGCEKSPQSHSSETGLTGEYNETYQFSWIYHQVTGESLRFGKSAKDSVKGEHLAEMLKYCNKIPQDAKWSGIMDTMSDKQVYYHRSVCLYQLAQRSRQPWVCDQVVEARHFLYDGSFYSPINCKKQIALLNKTDQFEQEYRKNPSAYRPHQVADVRGQWLESGECEIIVASHGNLPGLYHTNVVISSLDPQFRGSSQLEPVRANLDEGAAETRFIAGKPYVDWEMYRQGLRVKASLTGPIEFRGINPVGVFFAERKAKSVSINLPRKAK